ncbi:unnamed protein product, partial [Scytosiphon promiscuus]
AASAARRSDVLRCVGLLLYSDLDQRYSPRFVDHVLYGIHHGRGTYLFCRGYHAGLPSALHWPPDQQRQLQLIVDTRVTMGFSPGRGTSLATSTATTREKSPSRTQRSSGTQQSSSSPTASLEPCSRPWT